MRPHLCVDCGSEFPSGTHRRTKRCATCRDSHLREQWRAKSRQYYAEGKQHKGRCGACGKPVPIGNSSRTVPICHGCRRKAKNLKLSGLCARCGKQYRKSKPEQKYCSVQCVNKPADPYRNQRKCAARAARKRGAFVEVVDPLTLFERDGWTCHLCKKKVRRNLSGMHLDGPTIDHIIPLAEGGQHSYANTALAHRRCNSNKGARAVGEQLALVG